MHIDPLLIFLIIIVAFFYSSIGHGGASGYLAIMTLYNLEPQALRSSALLLNLFVSGTAFYQYYRKGYFRWNLFYSFAITSIPASFIGGIMSVNPSIYKKLLGISLLFAVFRMTFTFQSNGTLKKNVNIYTALIIGAILGFVSGILGVGGGIFLSPIILLLHWANMKETAAVSAIFIFVNSIAGLSGILSGGFTFYTNILIWVLAAILGGLLGSYFGSMKLSNVVLKYILAVVLTFASIKLLI